MKNYKIRYGGSVCDEKEYQALILSISKSIGSGNWQAGLEAKKMEAEASKFLGVKYGILTTSGSCAGLLALSALELSRGSEVIISATTFPTIFNIILQCGLTPVVVDAEIGTYNFDIDEVEKAITKKTKAIIAIHALGNPVDMPKLMKIAKKHKIYVIEDNCLAEGTLVKIAKKCPNCGDVVAGCIKCGNTRKIAIDMPIEKVAVGDEVLTRKGYMRVLRTIYRGEKDVITKLGITATPDHPFITKLGIKGFADLQPSDIIYIWDEKSLCIEKSSITDIQNQNTEIKESTGIHHTREGGICTDIFTRINMAKFLKATSSIIKTTTHLIMNPLIWKQSVLKITFNYISKSLGGWMWRIGIWKGLELPLVSGTSLRKVGSGMLTTTNGFGQLGRNTQEFAISAKNHIRHTGRYNLNTALNNANGKVKVYDLTIQNEHEFFANGILVKNCDGWGGGIEI